MEERSNWGEINKGVGVKFSNMPMTKKGKEIMSSMEKTYGKKKGKSVFYASKNKGTIKGVDKSKKKAYYSYE